MRVTPSLIVTPVFAALLGLCLLSGAPLPGARAQAESPKQESEVPPDSTRRALGIWINTIPPTPGFPKPVAEGDRIDVPPGALLEIGRYDADGRFTPIGIYELSPVVLPDGSLEFTLPDGMAFTVTGASPESLEPAAGPAAADDSDWNLREMAAILEEELSTGYIVFKPKEAMTMGEDVTVRVAVTRSLEIAEAKMKDYADALVRAGRARVETLDVGTYMKVTLCCGPPQEDHAFDIVAFSDERQVVTDAKAAEWAFSVTPQRAGTHKLRLSAKVYLTGPNVPEDTLATQSTFERDILVEVDYLHQGKRFVANNWQWLAGTIFLPLIVFFWKGRRGKGKSP